MPNILFLAAGTSGRILKISKGKPKPLINIKRKTILFRNFNWVVKSKQFKKYYINSFFKPKLIKKEINKIEKKLSVKISINEEKKLLGTAGAIKNLQNKLGNLFFVVYSDNLLNFNLVKMLSYHLKKKSDITMALYSIKRNPFTGIASSSIKLNRNSEIINFNEKRSSKGNSKYLVNTGVIIFNNKIFKYIKKNSFTDLSNDIFGKIVHDKKIGFFGYKIETKKSYCLAIDTPEAFLNLKKLLKKIKLEN
tara:strand:+ start:1807 stop:2556 length:750 start_codon:yes stop_codon:yes gene_type:complete